LHQTRLAGVLSKVAGNFSGSAGFERLVLKNLFKSLIAVGLGNALYFLVLTPWLPRAGRHQPFHFDLGLIIDLWMCLVVYGMLHLALWWKNRGRTRS